MERRVILPNLSLLSACFFILFSLLEGLDDGCELSQSVELQTQSLYVLDVLLKLFRIVVFINDFCI